MMTPAYAITATERVLPRLALDFTTGSLDPRVTVARALNTATRTNSSGFIEGAGANLPRFDYDPVTLAPKGLLIEEARTNICLNSETLNTGWLATEVSVGANVEASPDGTQNADSLTDTANLNVHVLRRTGLGISPSTTYTYSFYVKPGTQNFVLLWVADGNAVNRYASAVFDVTPGNTNASAAETAISTGVTLVGTTQQSVGNGWYRLTFSFTSGSTWSSATTSARIGFAPLATGNTFDGFGGISYSGTGTFFYAYGAQLEAGAFATSYIPTTTTSVTRNADVVSMTGTNFSDWYNASEGTFLINANRYLATAGFPRMLSCSDNTAANEIALYIANATSRAQVLAIDNTVIQANAFATYSTQQINLCGRFKLNSFAGSLNGGAVFTDSVGTMPVGLTQMTIGTGPATTSPVFSGHISKILYWPQGLTNSEVQAFAKG